MGAALSQTTKGTPTCEPDHLMCSLAAQPESVQSQPSPCSSVTVSASAQAAVAVITPERLKHFQERIRAQCKKQLDREVAVMPHHAAPPSPPARKVQIAAQGLAAREVVVRRCLAWELLYGFQ